MGWFDAVGMADWLRLAAALAVVAPAAYLAARVVGTRPAARRGRRVLRLVDALPLGAGRYVYVVAVGRRLLVLAVTGSQVVRLDTVEAPEAVDELVGQSPPAPVSILDPATWGPAANWLFRRRG